MTINTIRVKPIAFKEEPGGYEIIVFQNLDTNTYLMCTKLPNWSSKTPSLNDVGYLQYREFIAGQDTWYNVSTGNNIPYAYTGIYFWDFVRKEEKINKELKLD